MRLLLFIFFLVILYPLSLLPFPILYLLSDLLFLLIYYVVRYRRKVVLTNLSLSFPQKSKQEIEEIARKFYRNLGDIIVENVKLLTITKQTVLERCAFINPEVVNSLAAEGKSIIATIGHCGNWELAGLSTSLSLNLHTMVFYRPFKNQYFDKFIRKSRGKFGMELVADNKVRQILKQEGKQPNLYIFITDQTPSNISTCHWTTFLNQHTPVFKGTEKMAKLTNIPVVFTTQKDAREKRSSACVT